MILGLSSFTYGWSVGVPGNMPDRPLTVMDLANRTKDFGLTCLQIGDNLPLHELQEEDLMALKTFVIENNIRLEVGARKLTEDNLQHYINIAASMGSPLLRFVVDGDQYEPEGKTIIQTIKATIPSLYESGVILGIENHDRFKAHELAAIMNVIDDRQVGICLDCVNSLGAGEGLDYVVSTLAPYTVNLHIKDYKIERLPHKMGFHVTGAPAGKGMTDVPMILDKLAQYQRCDSAVLEQWVTPERMIEDTVKKEEDWAIEGVNYLKGLPYFGKQNMTITR